MGGHCVTRLPGSATAERMYRVIAAVSAWWGNSLDPTVIVLQCHCITYHVASYIFFRPQCILWSSWHVRSQLGFSVAYATKLLCMHLQPGFYDVSRDCLPCGCNLGGSESTICNQSTVDAQCPCKPNIDSITCTAPLLGYFFRPLDFILFEAEEAELSQVWLLSTKLHSHPS